MFNPHYNTIPFTNRKIRRKVDLYRRKHPELTFTQAYNKVFGTNYDEPREFVDTRTYDEDMGNLASSSTDYPDSKQGCF